MVCCSMFRDNILEWTENRPGARNCCHRSAVWPSLFNLCTAVTSPGNEDRKDHLHHPPVHPRAEGWISPLNTSEPMAEERSSPPHGVEPRDTSVTLLYAVHPAKPQQRGCSEDRHLVLCLYHAGRQPCRSIVQAQDPDAMPGPLPLLGLIQWLLASATWESFSNFSMCWSTPYESHHLAASAA